MSNLSSIYPEKEGCPFDFDYYLNKHMPMSIELLSGAKGFMRVSVEQGIDIEDPKIESSYVAMCHYCFELLGDFMAAFGPHAEKFQGDIVNYTNIEQEIQINEVRIFKAKHLTGHIQPTKKAMHLNCVVTREHGYNTEHLVVNRRVGIGGCNIADGSSR
jgi:uncharacterized protein (TIGR02118 family)